MVQLAVTNGNSVRTIAVILAVAAMLPGVFTALVVVQDSGDQISYYISSTRASSLHSQLSQAPGGFAWDYLRGDDYPVLKVEWTAFNRHILDSRSSPFSSFESMIFSHCNKSSITYTFVGTMEASLQQQVYSEADLNRLYDTVFRNTTSNGVAIVHVAFLTGSFSDPAAVGISFTADRFAIFGDTLIDAYLRVSIAHEMGHLLGLVAPLGPNSPYTPRNATVHYDYQDPPHCTSNPCLMRPVVSSYDKTCSFCNADMLELKNSTAPYAFDQKQPTIRSVPIIVGAIITLFLAVPAFILYRRRY
ncbi:MAG TPA: hypothetical protein VGK23_07045 [Methanomassiliicoccales archaeon]|jgi:hypothetical protein